MQRRLGATLAGTAAVLALGLTACAPSNTPTSYDSAVVEQNFLEGCLNRYVNLVDDTLAVTDDTLSPDIAGGTQQQCECQFQVFVDQVPFNSDDTSKPGYVGPNFSDLNKSLQGDNGGEALNTLPTDVQDDLKSCALPGQSGSGTGTTLPTETTTTLLPTSQNTTPDGRPLDG
jgi:hypothetical protein